MGNRAAKFISTLIASILAGAPLAAVSQDAPSAPAAASTANAATDCLASPKGTAPQGQHWHYRLERTTKRQCWYLRAEGAKAPQSAQTTADAPKPDPAAPQAAQNARAEYAAPQTAAPAVSAPAPAAPPPAAPQPASVAIDSAQQPAVATSWPDPAATSPAPQPAPTAVTVSAPAPAKPAKPAAAMALAAADSSADKPTGSLQMLLLAIGGALALAGILASLIYRFAGARGRIRTADRRGHWDDWEPQDYNPSRALRLHAIPTEAPRAPQPVDFDAACPRPQQAPHLAALSSEIGKIASPSRATRKVAAELDAADIFDGELKIAAAAPRLSASDVDEDARIEADIEDDVDIDVITAMLERLAQQGPRLAQPSFEADLADFAQSRRGQSAARA
jgi:hypothetical protein